MAAQVPCALCGQKKTTENLKTGYMGCCPKCNIHWCSSCHTIRQCPHCGKYL